ncbi:MAG: hypothetical protein ACRDFB_00110, partial [Rhabdochlamydiaceae bacterium]
MGGLGQGVGGGLGTIGGVAVGAAVPGADLTGVPEVAGGAAGEKIGQTVGGGGGQGLGEFLKNLIQGKQNTKGDIAKSAGEGAVYGLLPGSQEGRMATKFLSRFLGGAAVGGGSQAISDIGNKKSLNENLGNIAQTATTTGILNSTAFPILGSILKVPAKLVGGIGKQIVNYAEKIREAAIEAPTQLEKELKDVAIGYRFGNTGTQFAKDNGLVSSKGLSTEGLKEETSLISNARVAKENQLHQALKDSGVTMPIGDVLNPLGEVASENGYNLQTSKKLPKVIQDARDLLTNAAKNTEAIPQKVTNGIGRQFESMEHSGYKEIPLTVVNQAKRILGTKYYNGENPTVEQQMINNMYNSLKDNIEGSSG